MAPYVITVVYGGEWRFSATGLSFVGEKTSKVFILNNPITFERLEEKVRSRFNIDAAVGLEFNHLHPLKLLRSPLKVDCDADFEEFLALTTLANVKFAVELCVSKKFLPQSTVDADARESWRSFTSEQLQLVEYNMNLVQNIVEKDSTSVMSDLKMKSVKVENMEEDDWSQGSESETESDAEVWRNLYSSMQGRDTLKEEWDDSASSQLVLPNNSSEILYVGKTFVSRQAAKDALTILSVTQTFGFRVTKSEPRYFRVHCMDAKCNWKMHLKTVSQTSYVVTLYNEKHTCTWDARTKYCKKAPSSVVARLIEPRCALCTK